MRKLILICIGVMCMFSLHAQDKVQADSAYAAEKYEEAIPIYTALLKEGEHADIYYNLGNCYYKTDRLALAILNYERAALLDPGSSDVRFNLELARSKTIDKITPESEMFFVTWYKNIIDMMSMDGWARTGIVAFVLACVLILVFFLGNKVVWKKLVGGCRDGQCVCLDAASGIECPQRGCGDEQFGSREEHSERIGYGPLCTA